ncbi:hypothetical protein C1H46_044529 [Malus baccata]|uniref:Uncharacterized protein n=1 Tax=Malus baccata TaxID=106549 RepID=A0A540K6T8_MALBA|nr:hypothetical protein C1H46_044529 [Malus baccata]
MSVGKMYQPEVVIEEWRTPGAGHVNQETFVKYVKSNDWDNAIKLLSQDPQLGSAIVKWGGTALHYAIRKRCSVRIIQQLVDLMDNEVLEMTDVTDCTALYDLINLFPERVQVAECMCSSSLMIAYGGDRREPELLSVPVSLTRRGYPRIIPAFHCRVIYGGGPRADECVRFYLSVFSLYRIVILAKKISKNTFEPFITPIKDMDRVLSSIQARFCLNLRGRRRSGSPATTSVDPTKSLNLAAARSLISDSPATTSMKNLSKICFLISDSPATTFRDPTLFSNLAARLIGTPVGSSCIQILGVPGPASTKNISSLKRKTSDCKAFPLHKKKLELDLGNARLK